MVMEGSVFYISYFWSVFDEGFILDVELIRHGQHV